MSNNKIAIEVQLSEMTFRRLQRLLDDVPQWDLDKVTEQAIVNFIKLCEVPPSA